LTDPNPDGYIGGPYGGENQIKTKGRIMKIQWLLLSFAVLI